MQQPQVGRHVHVALPHVRRRHRQRQRQMPQSFRQDLASRLHHTVGIGRRVKPGRCIPYEKLIGMNDMDYAKLNIDRTQLETYLSPNEFINALGVTPTEFNALPGWKKKNLKRKKKLF